MTKHREQGGHHETTVDDAVETVAEQGSLRPRGEQSVTNGGLAKQPKDDGAPTGVLGRLRWRLNIVSGSTFIVGSALVATIGQILSLPLWVLVAAIAVLLGLIAVVALVYPQSRAQGTSHQTVAVVMLLIVATVVAIGAMYRYYDTRDSRDTTLWTRESKIPLTVELSRDDPFPQGAVVLSPVKLGPDFWKGDISIECITPQEGNKTLNCTDGDARDYIVAPIDGRASIADINGDAFAEPSLCNESRNAQYRTTDVKLVQSHTYCLRRTGEYERMVTLRIVKLPTEHPRPKHIELEAAVWSH
ncbi:MAG: hypothetical protein M3228_06825 [Actinomycetota bacterium]|nr:hypothetical protein [Actinomycetota bacterium]